MDMERDLTARAQQIAAEHSYVESQPVGPLEITGDPIIDTARRLNMSQDELAVRVNTPADFQALEEISCILYGGLGPAGARNWLEFRLETIPLDEILKEARRYLDSPAT